jgi:hypothetical protein
MASLTTNEGGDDMSDVLLVRVPMGVLILAVTEHVERRLEAAFAHLEERRAFGGWLCDYSEGNDVAGTLARTLAGIGIGKVRTVNSLAGGGVATC